ncbi:monooxygenase [Kineococcus glutinatus]|uniref:monooxygenase n=1 Tax=Kineococcus glutinatus TaxID=1070872 RepID=UPI0031E9913F
MSTPPGLVTLHLWGVPTRAVPAAAARMALDRRHLARAPGVRFAKLLGTGSGRTFSVADADPHRWALLVAWDSAADADAFETGRTVRAWGELAAERLVVRMRPLSSRGTWSGAAPFGGPGRTRCAGPVASITRARLRALRAAAFYRAVPPVAADLQRAPGLRLAVGIGEAPVGLQGTFSLWSDDGALRQFAHRRSPHLEVVRRTAAERWYAEELFARFQVLAVEGTVGGRTP